MSSTRSMNAKGIVKLSPSRTHRQFGSRQTERKLRLAGFIANHLPNPAGAGQAFAKKQVLEYKVNGSAEVTDLPLVRALASPLLSMVRESSATVVSAAMCIPFERSSRGSTFPMAQPFINNVGASHASSKASRRGVSQCRWH